MLAFTVPLVKNEKQRAVVEIDEDIFLKIAEDDMDAFEELYRTTKNAVYGYILAFIKNTQDAEDIMQDTYIKIRASAHLYRPQGKPLAWIFTIARNFCLMKVRAEKKMSYLNYDDLENKTDFSSVQNKENRILLENAFLILSGEERQIIILHALTGMKHREIAEIMDMPISSVLSKYSRALKKLRKNIEGEE